MTSDFRGFNNTELVRIIHDESEKKGLDSNNLFIAMEEALRVAGRDKYGNNKLKIEINRKTGSINVYKEILVVEDGATNNQYVYDTAKYNQDDKGVVDVYGTIKLSDAVVRYPDQKLESGSIVLEGLSNVDFGRLAVRTARYAILDSIKKLEQEKQYQKYKDRVGDVVIGSVRRITKYEILVDLGDSEVSLPMKNCIRGEIFRQGDRIKAIIDSVQPDDRKSQVILSRANKSLIAALFKQEIPEIYDGIITINAIAREAGSKSKIAVHSVDKNIDPIGACVGIRSSRIKAITQELNGEKIDVIIYSADISEFVINAITPAKATKAILNEEKRSIELIVEHDQLSLAIGKKGQNVRLASELVGWSITILSEDDASKKKLEEFSTNTEVLVAALNVEEIIAQILIAEGFVSVEDIAKADVTKLSIIEGFEINIANELFKRAQEYIEKHRIDSDLKSLSEIDDDNATLLQANGITDLEALADLSTEDFYDTVKNHKFTEEEINNLIISARTQLGWFKK